MAGGICQFSPATAAATQAPQLAAGHAVDDDLFGTMNAAFISAMTVTTAANTIILQYTAPVWMILGGRFFFGEVISAKAWASLGVACVGVLIIVDGEGVGNPMGIGLALLAGLSYAGVALHLRYLRDENGIWMTFLNHAGAALICVPLVLLTLPATATPWPTTSQWWLLLAFGATQMALPYVIFARGLRTTAAQDAALITLIEPLLNPILVLVFWAERPSAATLAGGCLIFAALILRYSQPRAWLAACRQLIRPRSL